MKFIKNFLYQILLLFITNMHLIIFYNYLKNFENDFFNINYISLNNCFLIAFFIQLFIFYNWRGNNINKDIQIPINEYYLIDMKVGMYELFSPYLISVSINIIFAILLGFFFF